MKTLKNIVSSIYKICFDVDAHISGYSEEDANLWAKANAVRHAHTIRMVLDYAHSNRKKSIKILNASGLGCGHQDFSIASFLKNKTDIKAEWTGFDSPDSGFVKKDLFKKYVEEIGIKLEFSDFSKTDRPYGEGENLYDVIIFTEIAEHLDHSTLIKLLTAIKIKMKKDGILIITTPNLVDIKNRIRILFGDGDGPYWGDTPQTIKSRKGFYGHIVNYDIGRLNRIMSDLGYKINIAYTFNYGYGPAEKSLIKRLMYRLIDLLSFFLKDSRKSLFIVASK